MVKGYVFPGDILVKKNLVLHGPPPLPRPMDSPAAREVGTRLFHFIFLRFLLPRRHRRGGW